MLIRSQDKEMIVNIYTTNHIFIGEAYRPNGNLHDVCADEMRLGYYSTREKAMKVLDMIQEAYERYEYEKVFKTGLTLFETFQIPKDSEVEA